MFLGMQTVPSGEPFPKDIWGRKIAVLVVCHNGAAAEAEAAVNGLRDALPGTILDLAGPMPYPALQSLFDGLYPKGLQWYWKGDFVDTLPDRAIEIHIAQAMKAPSEISAMHLYPIDGAVHRKAKEDAAWATRDATWSMVIVAVDPDPKKAPALKTWAKDYWTAIHPFNRDGAYPNFMMDDEGDARLKATFGANYPRLVALKQKFDPQNLFRMNLNIRP